MGPSSPRGGAETTHDCFLKALPDVLLRIELAAYTKQQQLTISETLFLTDCLCICWIAGLIASLIAP
jgi:hypothetical protein